MSGDRELVALALTAADGAEAGGREVTANLLRRLAGRVAELSALVVVEPEAGPSCRGCGKELELQVGPGRPRQWCRKCRPRDRRAGAKSDAKCTLLA